MLDIYHRIARHFPEQELIPGRELALRGAAIEDEEVLFALFAETHGDWSAPLPAAQAGMLMRMQFLARRQSYGADFPGSLPAIVLRGEEVVGTLWVAGSADEYRMVDIAILNAFRRNGIASALVSALIEEARAGGKVVCSSVAKSNAVSLRFHERLGFAIRGEDAVYYQLRAV